MNTFEKRIALAQTLAIIFAAAALIVEALGWHA